MYSHARHSRRATQWKESGEPLRDFWNDNV